MRGIKSPDYANMCRGEMLTDKRIDYYRRKGRYGEHEKRLALEEQRARRAKRKEEKADAKVQSQVQALLDLLKS